MRGKSFWIATSCSAAMFLLMLSPLASARGNGFRTIHHFQPGRDGSGPYAGLISDSVGNLYGITVNGGFAGYGTIFKLTPNANGRWSETLLYSFTGNGDGANPQAGLILDASGNLLGTTLGGGAQGAGTVFMLNSSRDGSWSETVLYSFTGGQDGAVPVADLISDAHGDLFGTTLSGGSENCVLGCGVVFELTQGIGGSWSEKVIHSFDSQGSDGFYPFGTLMFDVEGRLYGTTEKGGQYGDGTVFQLVQNDDGTWAESMLHSFNGKDGSHPMASLIFDAQGSLYGTTNEGGAHNLGVTFQLTPDGKGGWDERILHSFRRVPTDGVLPKAGLAFDKSGNLYGTTIGGGSVNDGTIFRLTPTVGDRWHETVVHSFRNRPGCNPTARLLVDPQGVLFGTTYGCFSGEGSAFTLTP